MVISATTFSGGVTNAGTIGAGGVAVTSSTFLTGGFLNSQLISAQQTGIGVLADSTIHGAIVDSGTISATGIGIFVNGGIISGGIQVASHGAISAHHTGIEVFSDTFGGGISNSGTIFGLDSGIHAHGFATFSGGISNRGNITTKFRNGILVLTLRHVRQ